MSLEGFLLFTLLRDYCIRVFDANLFLVLFFVFVCCSPTNLLRNKASQFYSMVHETGPENAEILWQTALATEKAAAQKAQH
jgi:hypothetical protein